MKNNIEKKEKKNDFSCPFPHLTVDGLVLNFQRKILLLKRKIYPFKNSWVLPGGFVEYGERVEEAIVREIKEETGLQTKIKKFLGVYSDPQRDPRAHHISLAYLLKIEKGKIRKNFESSQIKFFSLKRLPQKIGFDHQKIIEDFLKKHSFFLQKNPPSLYYPLYKKVDKELYFTIKKTWPQTKQIKLLSLKEKDEVLKKLIISQLLPNYRISFSFWLTSFKKKKISFPFLKKKCFLGEKEEIDDSWAIFRQDKEICRLGKRISFSKIKFKGKKEEIIEFILRFLLSCLLYDWRTPLWESLLFLKNKEEIDLKEFNSLLEKYDLTMIFL